MRRLLALTTILLGAALPATAGAGPDAHAAAVRTVTLKGIAIHPATIRIHAGDTVRWLFRDRPTPHNVTSRGAKRFRSSPTKQTGTYSVRFTKAGTYRYVCTIHPNMRGTVVVG